MVVNKLYLFPCSTLKNCLNYFLAKVHNYACLSIPHCKHKLESLLYPYGIMTIQALSLHVELGEDWFQAAMGHSYQNWNHIGSS